MGLSHLGDLHDDRTRSIEACEAPAGGDTPCGGASGSVAATCRYYGISRQCYYVRLRRYEAEGLEGLKDRSSAPHHTPHATQADVVEKILRLRQQYHFRTGNDRDVLGAVSRRQGQLVRRVAHPEEGGSQPAAGLPALQAPLHPLEAVREAAPRPPASGRRQVHRPPRPDRPQEALLPVRRH